MGGEPEDTGPPAGDCTIFVRFDATEYHLDLLGDYGWPIDPPPQAEPPSNSPENPDEIASVVAHSQIDVSYSNKTI